MDLIFSNKQFVVFDNVLSEQEFQHVWSYLQTEDYHPVHQQKWQKVYRLCDGLPFEGPTVYSAAPQGADPRSICVFPTNRGIDVLFKKVLENADRFIEWVGKKGEDWQILTGKAFLFPNGSGLSWHTDRSGRTGSFSFYGHSQWNVQWGGELLVADESLKDYRQPQPERYGNDEQKRVGPQLDNSYENERLMERGVGHYVFPKPNRLVVIGSGNFHRINTSGSTGTHVRCSISGFFIKDKKE